MSRCVVCGLEIGMESEDLCLRCVNSAKRYEASRASLDSRWREVRIVAGHAGWRLSGDPRRAFEEVRDQIRRLGLVERAIYTYLLHEQSCPRCENCGDAIDAAEAIVVGGKHYCSGHEPSTWGEQREEASV